MPPFEYRPYDSRAWTGSIGDIIERQGQIPAEAALRIGQVQADAALRSGQAWGNAAQQTGQAVAGAIQQATDPRLEAERLKLKEAKTAIAEHDTFKKILKETPPVNENGMKLYDLGTMAEKATQAGIDPSAYLEHYANVNNGFRQEYAARMSTVQAGAKGLMLAPDATLAQDFLTRLQENHTISAEVHQHLSSLIEADPSPANILRIATPFAGEQKPIMGAPGATPLSPITGQPMGPTLPEKPVAVRPGGSLVNPQTGEVITTLPLQAPVVNPETERHNKAMEEIGRMGAGRAEAAQQETARHNRATEAQAAETNAAAPALTPDAIKLTARQFAMTGQLPPMGMGKQGAKVRTDIINAAAEEYKNLDLPTQVAAYKANQASLTKLQGQRDAIGSFEATAKKNIDLFLDTAGKVVDTGSPLINTPLRMVSGKLLGSPDQAAFDAARQVAVNEIAKITSNPTLAGTLSDSARHEIEAFNPASATLKQSVAVMRLLKQDMGNRTTSLDDQIKAIQQRIATKPGETPAATTGPTVGERRLINGKVGEWDGHGWKAVP